MKSNITKRAKTAQEGGIPITSSGIHHGIEPAVQQQHGHLRKLKSNRIMSNVASDNSEDAVGNLSSSERGSGTFQTPRSKPKTNGTLFDYFPISDLKRPLTLSVSGSGSTVSSPGTSADIWDIQQTPSRPSALAIDRKDLTPLTPPTNYELGSKKSFFNATTDSPLSLGIPKLSLSAQTRSGTAKSIFDEAGPETTLDDDEDFRPKKLFRNYTDTLNGIVAELDASRAELHLNHHPAYEFSEDVITNTRSTRTSTEKLCNASLNDHRIAHIKAERTTIERTKVKIETASIPQSPQLSSAFLTTILEYIMPADIHARLKANPGICVATLVSNPNMKCKNKAHGGLKDMEEILTHISRAYKKAEFSACVKHIKELVELVMCGNHCRVSNFDKRQERLRKVLSNLTKAEDDEVIGLKLWIRIISKMEMSHVEQRVSISIPEGPVPSRTRSSTQAAQVTCTKTLTENDESNSVATQSVFVAHQSVSIRGFTSYQPGWSRRLSVSAALLYKIEQPLKPTDLKPGFIYIFWDKETFGMVKIGRTDNLQRRLREWNTKCKRKYGYHAATTSGQLVEIPHVSRIEHLMHIELKDLRKEKKCDGCGTMHKEWFQTGDLHAVKVFQKWQQWIVQKPYEVDLENETGFIKPEMKKSLAEVCTPVLQDPMPKPSPRRSRESTSRNRRTSKQLVR